MPKIEVDDQTASALRLAADTAGISEGEVVRRLIERHRPEAESRGDRAAVATVAVFALYEGHRTTATYEPATHRVTITEGPLAGKSYKSPSGAAIAVVTHYRPSVNPNRNGWTFWTVSSSGELLQTLRRQR